MPWELYIALIVGSFVWWRRRQAAAIRKPFVQGEMLHPSARDGGSEGDGASESLDSKKRLAGLRDIAVTAIGPAWQSKSFLLNCLQKRDMFRVRSHPLRPVSNSIHFYEPFAVDELSVDRVVIAFGIGAARIRAAPTIRGDSPLVTLVDTKA